MAARAARGAALALALSAASMTALHAAPPGAAATQPAASARDLATVAVGTGGATDAYVADGRVEAVREATISAQVSGRVVALRVRNGDRVRAGQELARIDSVAAQHNEAAVAAQLAAAQAQQVAAQRNYERTRQLVTQNFLSPATLDRVEAEKRAADETVRSLQSQRAGAATQTGWHRVLAPFDGIVISVATELGDTAMPGKPLMVLHDPKRLRVAVDVPAALVARLALESAAPVVDIPDAPTDARSPKVGAVVVVPAADPVAHTQLVRIELDGTPAGLHPGLFARVRLALKPVRDADTASRVSVPRAALVVRGDLRAVYVVTDGEVALRQVRAGRTSADQVEVLSGLAPGERVALDPVAAARVAGRLVK